MSFSPERRKSSKSTLEFGTYFSHPHSLCHRRRSRGLEPDILSNPVKVASCDNKNCSTLTLLNSHVSKTVASTRYSFKVASVNRAPVRVLYFANSLIACSALLLFHGTPS